MRICMEFIIKYIYKEVFQGTDGARSRGELWIQSRICFQILPWILIRSWLRFGRDRIVYNKYVYLANKRLFLCSASVSAQKEPPSHLNLYNRGFTGPTDFLPPRIAWQDLHRRFSIARRDQIKFSVILAIIKKINLFLLWFFVSNLTKCDFLEYYVIYGKKIFYYNR